MKTLPLALALVLAPAVALAQEAGSTRVDPEDLEQAFYCAYYAENGLRDFEKAADAYAQVAEAASKAGRKDLVEKSLLGRARCLGTMGKGDLRKQVLEALLATSPDNTEARAMLAPVPGAGDESQLSQMLRNLVAQLGGDQRENAAKDLQTIGPPAVPFLEEALRSVEVGRVQKAAEILMAFHDESSTRALERALRDPAVSFHQVLVNAVLEGWAGVDALQLRLLSILQESPDPSVRERVIGHIRSYIKDAPRPEAAEPAVLRALSDPDRQVRAMALSGAWPVSVRKAALGKFRECLRSTDEVERELAFDAVSGAAGFTETAVLLADDLREIVRNGGPSWRGRAFAALRSAGQLSSREFDATLREFLVTRDAFLVGTALRHVATHVGGGEKVTASAVEDAFLRCLRDIAEGGGDKINQGDISTALAKKDVGLCWTMPVEKVVEVYAIGCADPTSRTWGRNLRNHALQALTARTKAGSPERSAVFAEGLQRVTSPAGRIAWCRGLFPDQSPFPWDEASAGAAVSDPSPGVRLLGYEALGRLLFPPGKAKAPPLPHIAEDLRSYVEEFRDIEGATWSSGTVGQKAMVVASLVRDPALAKTLREVVADSANDVNRRDSALQALVAAIGEDAVPDIREVLLRRFTFPARDLLVQVQGLKAAPALLEVARKWSKPEWVIRTYGGAVPDWRSALPKEVLEEVLDGLPVNPADSTLFNLVAENSTPERRSAWILAGLASKEPSVQKHAANKAKNHNLVEAWRHLLPLLDSQDLEVRREAKEALEYIRSLRELKESYARVNRLQADEGGKALADAKAMLKSGDPAKRRGAALALGALGDPSAVALLLRVLDDDADASVREAALAALERLGGRPAAEPR